MEINKLRIGDLVEYQGNKCLVIYKTLKTIKLKLEFSTIEITNFDNDDLLSKIGLVYLKNVLKS